MGLLWFFLFLCTDENEIDFYIALRNQLILHEGYMNCVYLDPLNNPTYGVGHLITTDDYEVAQHISTVQVEQTLAADIKIAIEDAKSLILSTTWDAMTTSQRIAWTNFVFNVGKTNAKGFVKTIAYLNTEHWYLASREILRSKWATQVGKRRATHISKALAGDTEWK